MFFVENEASPFKMLPKHSKVSILILKATLRDRISRFRVCYIFPVKNRCSRTRISTTRVLRGTYLILCRSVSITRFQCTYPPLHDLYIEVVPTLLLILSVALEVSVNVEGWRRRFVCLIHWSLFWNGSRECCWVVIRAWRWRDGYTEKNKSNLACLVKI